MPVTTPVVPTVALALLLLQVPPDVASDNVIWEATHTVEGPVIVPALVMLPIVIIFVAVAVPQVPETVYLIVSIPEITPVTTPVVPIVAFALLALHIPPETTSLIVICEPIQTLVGPVIMPAFVIGFTVIGLVTRQPVDKV